MSETTLNQIKVLPEQTQLKFFWAVANYGVDGIEPDFTGLELAIWIPMRDLISHTKRKDNNWREKQQRNGKKGGRPPKTQNNPDNPTEPNETQDNPNGVWVNSETHNDNVNVNVNENVNVNDNPDASASFDGSSEPPLSESEKDAFELSTLLLTTHRAEIPDYLSGKDDKKTIKRWAEDIEKLIRIDGKPPDRVRQVILWAKTPGNFWFNNIQSGQKLREQFERLYGQMLEKKSTGPPRQRISADDIPPEEIASYFKEVT
ncbi:MAG: DUF6291 domain-containing protein [Tannerella sp.]|nr:DUF6291 domain-containing protein [Tannerella sp.]